MALNDVKFVTTQGGLGRLPVEKDYVSAIIISLAATPSGWTASSLGKKYLSLGEAEDDGIVEGDANFGLLWYFISEFFRIAGASELYVVDAADADFSAQNVYDLSDGEIRQAVWYTETAYTGIVAQVGTIKTFVNAMDALKAPLVVVTNVKDEATAVNGTANPTLAGANAPEVSVLISGSNSGKGASIADTDLSINYVPALGTVLGQMAITKVGNSIGWVENANLTGSGELVDIRFSDGQTYNAVADSVKDTLQTNRYMFLRRYQGVTGAYVNLDLTCVAATSDFARIRNVRTIQKAKRVLRAALIPKLQSPLQLDADGKLSADTVKFFENLAGRPLERMQAAAEISNFQVIIDPDQDVLATDVLNVQVKIQPLGAAETIEVTIGFEAQLS